ARAAREPEDGDRPSHEPPSHRSHHSHSRALSFAAEAAFLEAPAGALVVCTRPKARRCARRIEGFAPPGKAVPAGGRIEARRETAVEEIDEREKPCGRRLPVRHSRRARTAT